MPHLEIGRKDKMHSGALLELSRGNMIYDIVALMNHEVITTVNLVGFDDELRKYIHFFA